MIIIVWVNDVNDGKDQKPQKIRNKGDEGKGEHPKENGNGNESFY